MPRGRGDLISSETTSVSWRFPIGCGIGASGSLIIACFGSENINWVFLGVGTSIMFAALAVGAASAILLGPPAPPRLAGICLVISGAGGVFAWTGREVISSRRRDLGPVLLFLAVVLVAMGVWLLLRPSKERAGVPRSTSKDGDPPALASATQPDTDAVDVSASPEAAVGPAWVWFASEMLQDGESGSGCWDWYSTSEEWPAGRESDHVADASATLGELRNHAAQLLDRDHETIHMVLAHQTIRDPHDHETMVIAYLIR